jgi:hypothetical protein
MCTCCRLCKLNDIKFSCCLNGMDSTSYQVGIIKITTNDVVYITKTSNNVKAPVTYNCFSQSDVFVINPLYPPLVPATGIHNYIPSIVSITDINPRHPPLVSITGIHDCHPITEINHWHQSLTSITVIHAFNNFFIH